jgi:predicted amidohydrolase
MSSRNRVAALAAVLCCALVSIAGAVDSSPPTTRPATVKVAAVQCSSDLGAVEANRQKLTKLCEEAAGNGAKIIVLPEAAITGYLSQDLKTNWRVGQLPMERAFGASRDPITAAESVPGPSTKHFAALAKRLGAYITVPLVECDSHLAEARQPTFYNTVCLVSPKGELVAHYRKLTPWPYPEKSWATAGDRGVQTYDTEYGRVGLAICYDIHTILPQYQPKHIWALLYPIAWVDENHPAEWFWHKLPKQVAPFHHYVIGANWSVDDEQSWFGYGFSTIISPEGKVLATAKSLHGSEIVYAEIETASR